MPFHALGVGEATDSGGRITPTGTPQGCAIDEGDRAALEVECRSPSAGQLSPLRSPRVSSAVAVLPSRL